MATEDMSLSVNLSSIECRNNSTLIERLTVSWQIRVMGTILATNKLK